MNSSTIREILSDDEDENECRLTCSLRWLIGKAYPNGSQPDYLPCEHFFQLEDEERFLSPDIALVLLSGDLYIRAFQHITDQRHRFFTYEDLIDELEQQHQLRLDLDLLKEDEPLNANAHLDFIDQLIKLHADLNLDQTKLFHRLEKLRIPSFHRPTSKLDLESFFVIWLNGIGEHLAKKNSAERIPPVIDLRSALIDGRSLCALVSFYDDEFAAIERTKRMDLNFLRHYLNHHRAAAMTNLFPFTVKHLRAHLIPDLNLCAMLIDLFLLFEHDEDENPSNLTYSINDEEENEEEEEEDEEQIETNKTTWQRQAASNHSTPMSSARPSDQFHLNQDYLAVKMQLELKKRAIERDKQRAESARENKRQTISQEAFKQLLQQKSRQNAILNNEKEPTNIRKSQTTHDIPSKKNDSNVVDLSKPMSREEFLDTLELLKKNYVEKSESPPPPSPPPAAPSPPAKTNGIVMELIDDPSASTVLEMERKKELVLQRQQQRLEAFEQRRQRREMENHQRDDERRKKDSEETAKKLEREQRRDEIYRQYLMKKEKKSDGNADEHPTIKLRSKTNHRKTIVDPPILIAPFGTETELNHERDNLSFVRMAELRPSKTTPKIDSRTLPRPSARSATSDVQPALPLIPVTEPKYPLAKPLSGKSNKQTMVNALSQVILAGRVNDRQREQVCEEIERHADKVKHFILLFRDSRLQFRSVYAFVPSTADNPARLERLYGQGPKEITESMVETFYKYNNGSKQFSQLPIKSFSVQCDAITISNHYWSQSAATKRTTSAQFNTTTTSDS